MLSKAHLALPAVLLFGLSVTPASAYAADNSGNMSITVDSTDGMSAKDLADAFRAEFAKSFTSVGELEGPNDGDYEWDMTNNGVESHALVSVHESQFMLIVVTGAVTQDEAGAMLSTLQVK